MLKSFNIWIYDRHHTGDFKKRERRCKKIGHKRNRRKRLTWHLDCCRAARTHAGRRKAGPMAEHSRMVTQARAGPVMGIVKEYSGRQDGGRFGCSKKRGRQKQEVGTEDEEERKKGRVPAPVTLQMLGCCKKPGSSVCRNVHPVQLSRLLQGSRILEYDFFFFF